MGRGKLKQFMKKFLLNTALVTILFLAFSGCSSDSDSSCTPIPCLNGGVSNSDCGCDCPDGYTGINCATQVQPTKIKITKIRVTSFPNLKPSGFSWDALPPGFSNPDIFPYLAINDGANGLYAGLSMSDVLSNGNDIYDFIPTSPIIITNINQQLNLWLYDDDGGGNNEFMGGWNFYIYNSTSGFPTLLNVGTGNNNVKFQLTLSYEW